MPGNQKAPILLKKARDDQQLLVDMVSGVLGTDEQVGFHSQQAVEKAIKAVLETRGVSYRFTHDLAELIDALIDHSIAYPAAMDAAVDLTPFAAGLRYHDLPTVGTGEDTFDRDAAVQVVRVAIEWASGVINSSPG